MARGFYVLDSPTPRHVVPYMKVKTASRVPRIVTHHDIDRLLPDSDIQAFEDALNPDDERDRFDD